MTITTDSISPKYIISGTLANRPTSGAFEGQIYLATDTNTNYYWDGSSWVESGVDTSTINKLIGLNALNILDITAQSSLTAGTNANFERDIYTDADGYLNTIDTGNTTADFLTDKYINIKNEAHGVNLSNSASNSNSQMGCKITVGASDIDLYSVVKDSSCTATECRLKENDGTLIASAIFLGDEAIFSTIQTLSANTDYRIETYEGGNLYTRTYIAVSENFPISETDFDWVTGSQNNSDDTDFFNIVSLKINPSNKIAQTNTQTIDAGFTKFMIVSNEETTGTGSVTYDITLDGTNYQTDLSSFTEYDITNTGTSLILKQNLNAGASSGTATAQNWGVLLW